MPHRMKHRDFGFLAEIPAPKLVSSDLLRVCRPAEDAVLLAWNLRTIKRSQRDMAALLEIPYSHLSNILSGQKHLPTGLYTAFQWLCGNLALRQYYEKELAGLGLDFEVMEAERKLIELKARRAA